jgi:hypothetical protein
LQTHRTPEDVERSPPLGHIADIYPGVPTPVEPTCPQSSTGLEQPTSEKIYTSAAPMFSRFGQLAQSPQPL